jgi:hypothetical protein
VILQEAHSGGEDPAETRMRQQTSQRRGNKHRRQARHRASRKEEDVMDGGVEVQGEATMKPRDLQNPRRKLHSKMPRLLQIVAGEVGAPEGVVRGLAPGWLQADANLADN